MVKRKMRDAFARIAGKAAVSSAEPSINLRLTLGCMGSEKCPSLGDGSGYNSECVASFDL